MQKVLIIGILLSILACSSSREIVQSPPLIPTCHCEGKGDYTIVMDAGMGNWSIFYTPIFQQLKEKTQVCVIDRPGYTMNYVPTNSRDAKTIAIELENALHQNNVNDNIVLIGHSLGGLHVRMFQSLFPEKISGMILIDASHPKQFDTLPSDFHNLKEQQIETLDKLIVLAQKDYIKHSKNKIPTFGLPDSLTPSYYKTVTQPEYYYTMKMELLAFEKSLQQVSSLNDLGDLPLLVIASKNSMDKTILPGKIKNYPFELHNSLWLELQKDLSALSTNSKLILSDKNHYLHVSDHEFVSKEIKLFINHISTNP